MSKSYSELLKDPRWQRKRLEIMEREKFQCQWCGDTKATLNIHHGYYKKGLKPWEYQDDTLYCLCERCHKVTSKNMDDIRLRLGMVHPRFLDRVLGYLLYLSIGPNFILIENSEFFYGVCEAAHIDYDEIIKNKGTFLTPEEE